jgi:hypothetical protein
VHIFFCLLATPTLPLCRLKPFYYAVLYVVYWRIYTFAQSVFKFLPKTYAQIHGTFLVTFWHILRAQTLYFRGFVFFKNIFPEGRIFPTAANCKCVVDLGRRFHWAPLQMLSRLLPAVDVADGYWALTKCLCAPI